MIGVKSLIVTNMTPTALTPTQVSALQSYLCEQALLWQQLQRTIPGVELASLHICPDSAWIAIEHEYVQQFNQQDIQNEVNTTSVIRTSLVAKLIFVRDNVSSLCNLTD